MKKEKKTPTPLPSHHVLFAEPGFFLCNFFFVLLKHTQINPFFYFLFILLFIIYIAIIYFVFIRISHFFFSLCSVIHWGGWFSCAHIYRLQAAGRWQIRRFPHKKKKKKRELSERGRLKSRPREILVLTYVGNRIFNELWQLGRVVKAKD